MNIIDVNITGTEFEFNGIKYDAEFAINKDKRLIIAEAMESHKETFENEYDKASLKPKSVRLFLDEQNEISYAMVIYIIKYKNKDYGVLADGRYACGNYYPICKASTGKNGFECTPVGDLYVEMNLYDKYAIELFPSEGSWLLRITDKTNKYSTSCNKINVYFKYLHELQHALRLCGIEKTIEL